MLKDVVLQPGGLYIKEHKIIPDEITYNDLASGVKGFYFSAHWVSGLVKNISSEIIPDYYYLMILFHKSIDDAIPRETACINRREHRIHILKTEGVLTLDCIFLFNSSVNILS